MSEFETARLAMVNSQIRPNDVTDHRIQDAMADIPRERFLPKSQSAKAYADIEAKVAEGRFMLTPRDLAKLIQAADIRRTDVVLDVACGRGYSTAVLARMAETVVGLEQKDLGLVEKATDALNAIETDNAVVVEGDLSKGVPGQGPFDVIIVNGAVAEPAQAWLDQLAVGGRLAVIVRDGTVGQARIYTKAQTSVGDRSVFDTTAPYLPGFEPEAKFAF
ncbi:MAG: protein-L-isoaspartate O-methyltransferase [Oceanicaulis sp.]|jgi:protein-L-isoaspartate(D-aspartate) O-methyltransferase|uniref:protein-L-isoaspartate O-methyltransferase family protein n=1 Tax=unclassified Oceanicaulis TaxID=2632123 RepID=UPI000066D54B|nr:MULTISPECIES: protein-L-isoaspartate O-methyltransferase [unclassified Oceanicaulis]EAP91373.1 Protein-L-isoaspartate carboxylmethyltransferase [Oceanicaulis sp. HTCC2633]MAB69880.1 protein-L-isoaspartate O-methyltransferase [Oceanicaulis sp.]MBC39020.1 protein-L-isoaspartate O-methyltransferase [Oceanicaulis sp.]MBG34726.1 protein-L-isoaspartate O-methyltransferase [Oceanicaulis sp.]HBU63778.1 protein-L-isoaspartate O-methyltransferase [Oceanicaulis sp.]|tara:strand:+ start:7500 stop:8156 length:657 start_codon:yes stop_codon:yes gene_type:complete